MGASWVPLGCLLGVSWVLLGAPGCSWLLLVFLGLSPECRHLRHLLQSVPILPASTHPGTRPGGAPGPGCPCRPLVFQNYWLMCLLPGHFVSVGSSSQSWRKPLCFLFATTTICFCCWRISWWRPIRRMESCWLYIIIACAGLMRVLGSAKGGWRHGSKLLDPPAVGFCRARILFLRARMDSA
jgi:hypothetical protein